MDGHGLPQIFDKRSVVRVHPPLSQLFSLLRLFTRATLWNRMASSELEVLRRKLKEKEEACQKAAQYGLQLMDDQLNLQMQLDEQRKEMANAMEVSRLVWHGCWVVGNYIRNYWNNSTRCSIKAENMRVSKHCLCSSIPLNILYRCPFTNV